MKKMRRATLCLLIFLLLFSGTLHAGYWGCHRFNLPGWWGSVEYMHIWRKKRFFPPLVSTGPLGAPGTEILFGDERITKCPKSGFRGDVGLWLLPCLGFGVGGFSTVRDKISFNLFGQDGVPPFGRPFFDFTPPLTGTPGFDPISDPTGLTGSINIDAVNRIWGVDAYARYRLLNFGCAKLDLLGGAIYSSVRDTLTIDTQQEATIVIVFPIPVDIFVSDQFSAKNNFYGGLLGAQAELRSQNWAVLGRVKTGVGTMFESVDIDGNTLATVNGVPVAALPFGFLALPSNIGTHKRRSCQIIYSADIQAQLRIWCNFWLTVGYTYMHWQKVQLAGEAVDLNLNFGQLETPPEGPPFPTFVFHEKNFFAHGFTAGLYILF